MSDGRVPVVLLDADNNLGLNVVQLLAHAGRYRVTVVACAATSGLRYSLRCRYVRPAGWRWEAGPAQLEELAGRVPQTILFPVSERAVEWAIRHRDRLTRSWRLTALPDGDVLGVVCDKLRLARFAASHGIAMPTSVDANPELDDLPLPALLKPRRGSGGIGVERFASRDALTRRLRGLTERESYLVQTFVPGEDLSTGVLCRDGRVLAAAVYGCLSRQSEFGPFASIEIVHDPAVLDTVGRLMRALRWNGLANVDLRRGDRGTTYVLDVNPRVWACILANLVSGLNFADLHCRSALGEDVCVDPPRAGRYFCPRDSFALLRAGLLGRAAGRERSTWGESGFRFLWRDPVAYWAMGWRRHAGPRALLRAWLGCAAPRMRAPDTDDAIAAGTGRSAGSA